MNILWLATAEMENKSYMSTSFQSERSATPISEEKDPNEDPQCYEKPQETMYSELSDYSHLSRSVQSTQQLVRPAEQTLYMPNRLYDTAEETALDQQPYNARVATGTKPQRSVQNSAGKRPQIVTIVLLVLILLLLILVVVMLSFHLSLKDLCTCDSNSARITDNVNGIDCVTNSSLTLLQDKIDYILEQMIALDDRTAHNRTLTILHQMEDKFDASTHTLYNIMEDNTATAAIINHMFVVVRELLTLKNVSLHLASCSDIKKLIPISPSGYYHVNITQSIYCNMEELCGEEGGWTRLAYLNMSDITQNCPPGLEKWEAEGIRLCRIKKISAGCSEPVKFPTNGISYTHICGRVIGYQKGKTEALFSRYNDINDPYLDGVSITCGSSREHIWSFIAGRQSNGKSSVNCPCNSGSNVQIKKFIGNHYYCESGSNSEVNDTSKLYSSDPLWDGKNCLLLEAPCCTSPTSPNMPPWFHRDYGNATSTDYLELRVCRNAKRTNEDIPVQLYEIYVK